MVNKLGLIKTIYGAGGRSSNSGLSVAVFGAYGFIGRYLVNDLGACGSRVYLPFRGDEMEVRHLKPMFDLGQCATIPFSPRDEDSIRQAVAQCDVVVNLIGKYYETKHAVPTRRENNNISRTNYDFSEVNVKIPAVLAKIAKESNVTSFIHVSALSANKRSSSKWSQTKALGEDAVRTNFPEAIIVRPATVFGSEDRFLNWIADATTKLPLFPLINSGCNLVQPVYANDVGKALAELVKRHDEFAGKVFELAGPAEYSNKEVVEFVHDVIMQKKPLIDITPDMAKLIGKGIEQLVSPLFTEDMVYQLLEDNVRSTHSDALSFGELDITPGSMDRLAFDYLHRFRRGGHFTLAQGYH